MANEEDKELRLADVANQQVFCFVDRPKATLRKIAGSVYPVIFEDDRWKVNGAGFPANQAMKRPVRILA